MGYGAGYGGGPYHGGGGGGGARNVQRAPIYIYNNHLSTFSEKKAACTKKAASGKVTR